MERSDHPLQIVLSYVPKFVEAGVSVVVSDAWHVDLVGKVDREGDEAGKRKARGAGYVIHFARVLVTENERSYAFDSIVTCYYLYLLLCIFFLAVGKVERVGDDVGKRKQGGGLAYVAAHALTFVKLYYNIPYSPACWLVPTVMWYDRVNIIIKYSGYTYGRLWSRV